MKVKSVDGSLLRGSRPETDLDFMMLKNAGVLYTINLERGYFEAIHGITNRETLMSIRHGIRNFRMELGDISPPTKEEMEALYTLITTLAPPVFIHCAQGVDRTGMAVAFYRVLKQGYTVDQAIEEMKKEGMHLRYQWLWIPAFRNYFKDDWKVIPLRTLGKRGEP